MQELNHSQKPNPNEMNFENQVSHFVNILGISMEWMSNLNNT
jgi:hypothetical protein